MIFQLSAKLLVETNEKDEITILTNPQNYQEF